MATSLSWSSSIFILLITHKIASAKSFTRLFALHFLESQRDFVRQPRVARTALRWEGVFNSRPLVRPDHLHILQQRTSFVRTQPHWGWDFHSIVSQGSVIPNDSKIAVESVYLRDIAINRSKEERATFRSAT